MVNFLENEILSKIIVFLLCIVIFILNLILFVTYLKFKKTKIKIDIIIIEQTVTNGLFCYYYVDYIVRNANYSAKPPGFTWIYIFCILLLSLNIILNTIRGIELIFEMKKPLYTFTSIFNKKAKDVKWEIIAGVITFIIFVFGKESERVSRNQLIGFYIIDENLILIFLLLLLINFIVNFCSLIYYCCIKSRNKKEYLIQIIMQFIYCLFLLGFDLFLLFAIINDMDSNKKCSITSSYIVMLYLIINAICEMILVKQSDFYYYELGETIMFMFYKCCGRENTYVPPVFRENVEYSDIKRQKDEILYHFQHDLNFSSVCTSSLERSEYCLNCGLAGIYLVLENELNHNNIENQNNGAMRNPQQQIYDINSNNYQDNLIEINDDNNILNRKDKQFTFTNSDFLNVNDLSILVNYNQNSFVEKQSKNPIELQVQIDSLYHTTLTHIIKSKNININDIQKSIISHASTFPFLICTNSKERTFPEMPSLTLNTNDKRIFIQVFDSIDIKQLKKYLKHLHQKQFTFLPTLIGIYKITINSYSPFYILIINNENMSSPPQTFFNSWTLMKYNNNNTLQRIKSSHDRQSFLMLNENIKESDLKLKIKNYNTFTAILKDDFEYLKKIKSKSFTFTFIYYELKHEQNQNKEDSFNMINEPDINMKNNNKIIRDNKTNINLFDNVRFSAITERMPSINNNKNTFMPKNIPFINSQEIITNSNCFEGENGNYLCNIYFSFENVFEFQSRSRNKINYDECMNNLLKYFECFALDDEI